MLSQPSTAPPLKALFNQKDFLFLTPQPIVVTSRPAAKTMTPPTKPHNSEYKDTTGEDEIEYPTRRKSFYTALSCRDCCVITSVDGPICGVKPVTDDVSDPRYRQENCIHHQEQNQSHNHHHSHHHVHNHNPNARNGLKKPHHHRHHHSS